MLTKKIITVSVDGKLFIEGACLSSDEKPTDCANGSTLIEMDTSTLYFFDEDSKTWRVWQ